MRRSETGAATDRIASTAVAGATGSIAVPHSLQNLPVADVPQFGQRLRRAVPHDEQNFAPSALLPPQAAQIIGEPPWTQVTAGPVASAPVSGITPARGRRGRFSATEMRVSWNSTISNSERKLEWGKGWRALVVSALHAAET